MTAAAGRQSFPPQDRRALAAIDLGAESCRVSLLRWVDDEPRIELVHRFPNNALQQPDGLRWAMDAILAELERGLRMCADRAPEGIRSIAVDGWAVDYVRLDDAGVCVERPFCYRDPRNVDSARALHQRITPERMRDLTGIQLLPLNTLYQMHADPANLRARRWLNLPEYVLYTLGARPVAEFTNATHTQMVGLDGEWCAEILKAAEIPANTMPEIVAAGTVVGTLKGSLAGLPAFNGATTLIAPACHDTASAIAAIPDAGDDWAYISSGTWSLVGTTVRQPIHTPEANAQNFTNLGGAGGTTCFHKNVNGMWLLRQCLESWNSEVDGESADLTIGPLVDAAAAVPPKPFVLHVDDPDLLFPGRMPDRINTQLRSRNLPQFDTTPSAAPELAAFLFQSLAARYADVLRNVAAITGKSLRKLYIMGGGSQNDCLNRLTAAATGLEVIQAGTECSTVGNFAVQLATLERGTVPAWAARLAGTYRP